MPKPLTVKGTTSADLAALDRMIQELYDLVEAIYKNFPPSEAPKEPKQGLVYFDKDAGKLKVYVTDDTAETVTSA